MAKYNIPGLDFLKSKEENLIKVNNYKWFEKYRKEHVDFVKSYENIPRVIIDAEPKVGKRIFKIIECLRKTKRTDKNLHFIMITSLDRKDNKEQHEEMKRYGIECFLAKKEKEILNHIEKLYQSDNDEIYVFLDESDYGTDCQQKMSSLFSKICYTIDSFKKESNSKKYYLRYYSASNEEILHSEYGKKCAYFKFPTPPFYKGAKYFLENNLVHEAEPFFVFDEDEDVVPSQQAIQLLEEFSKQDKPFSILRVANKNLKIAPSYQSIKANKKIQDWLFQNFKIKFVFVDQNDSMNWGLQNNSLSKSWSDYYGTQKRIFMINQTCTRSTEISFLPLIFFWHDYRNPGTPYNTIIQASGRTGHYSYTKHELYWNVENPDTNVQLYTDVDCIKYRAGEISLEELNQKRNISSRIKSDGDGDKQFRVNKRMIDDRTIKFLDVPPSILKDLKTTEKNKQKYPALNTWLQNQPEYIKHKEQYNLVTNDNTKRFLRTISGNKKADIASSLIDKKHHVILAPIFIDGPNKTHDKSFNELLKKYGDVKQKIALVTISEQELEARKLWFKEKRQITWEAKNSMFNDASIQSI